jgi:hypothetical protein
MKTPIYRFECKYKERSGTIESYTELVASPIPEGKLLPDYVAHRKKHEKQFRDLSTQVRSLGKVGEIDLEEEQLSRYWSIWRFLTIK